MKAGSAGDFGRDAPGLYGNNAFTQNPINFENDDSNPQFAVENQWQRCGTGNTCNDVAIKASDIVGQLNFGAPTPIPPTTATQAHRNPPAFSLDSVSPNKGGRAGANTGNIVVLEGTGFNAIDGEIGVGCNTLLSANHCTPSVVGTCVEFSSGGDVRQAAEVLAVTPTRMVVRSPFECTQPVTVRVKRLNATNQVVTSSPRSYCTD